VHVAREKVKANSGAMADFDMDLTGARGSSHHSNSAHGNGVSVGDETSEADMMESPMAAPGRNRKRLKIDSGQDHANFSFWNAHRTVLKKSLLTQFIHRWSSRPYCLQLWTPLSIKDLSLSNNLVQPNLCTQALHILALNIASV